jgi:hypothetical protein
LAAIRRLAEARSEPFVSLLLLRWSRHVESFCFRTLSLIVATFFGLVSNVPGLMA